MANIQPFPAIRPNSFYADQLVFTKQQTESVAGDYSKPGSLKPLKTLLETGARLRPETSEGQMEAYQDIRDTLKSLLANDQLWREQTPGIYVYEVVHKTYRQTGLWALTSLTDYTGGNIKTHELTFSDSVRRIKNYRENTGLEGSPILLAYPPSVTINRIIAETKENNQNTTLGNPHGLHRLWKINDPEVQQQLIQAFSHIPNVYLADGHHRIESAAKLAEEQKSKKLPVYDTIASLYMATDQLRIREYDRVVLAEQAIDKADLFKQINKNFYIQDAWGNKSVQHNEPHWIGMYIQEEWYHLLAKPHTYANKGPEASIDAAILQEYVLAPIFGINDPKTDPQLKCVGGEKAMEEMAVLFQSHPLAIAFTLSPLTVEQLIAVADAGEILPPKSTWIDPKIPYGLLLHQHQPINKNNI